MNEAIQNAIEDVEEHESDIESIEAEATVRPLLTPDIIKRDKRRTDIVEIDFANLSARVVSESTAPIITAEVLKDICKPIWTVGMQFDGEMYSIEVRHGKPMRTDIEQSQILSRYTEQLKAFDEKTAQDLEIDVSDPALDHIVQTEQPIDDDTEIENLYIEREQELKLTLLARMIVNPVFSYGDINAGVADASPLADCSSILIDALWAAYCEVNHPLEPMVYQCQVLRGMPRDAAILLRNTLELYPVKSLNTSVSEMTDDDIITYEARETAQRRVFVASMILDPVFSLDGESGSENPDSTPFPIEDISVGALTAFFAAYKCVNRPEAKVDSLRRFRRMGSNGKG